MRYIYIYIYMSFFFESHPPAGRGDMIGVMGPMFSDMAGVWMGWGRPWSQVVSNIQPCTTTWIGGRFLESQRMVGWSDMSHGCRKEGHHIFPWSVCLVATISLSVFFDGAFSLWCFLASKCVSFLCIDMFSLKISCVSTSWLSKVFRMGIFSLKFFGASKYLLNAFVAWILLNSFSGIEHFVVFFRRYTSCLSLFCENLK